MFFYKQFMLMMVAMATGYYSRAQIELSTWGTTNNQLGITNKIIYHLEASFRSAPTRQQLQTFLLRTGAFVQLNKQWSLGGGYCLIDNRRTISAVTGYAVEHQALEQAWFIHPVYIGAGLHKHKTIMRHRLRLENRFLPNLTLENNALKKTGTSFANRLRYQLREQIPLVRSMADFQKGMYLILQNELFFNITGQQYANGKVFDQNRTLIATGYRFNRKIDLELSYMLRLVKDAGNGYTRENILQVTTFTRI